MATTFQDKPVRRGCRASLSHAFFRWESAVIIALTILLVFLWPAPFPWWQWWVWLILGVVAETLLILVSLSDVEMGQKAVSQEPQPEFDPRVLRDRKLREQAEKALEYRQRIDDLVQRSGGGVLRDATAGVSDWVAHISDIARRLDAYRGGGTSQKRTQGSHLQQPQDTMDRAELQLENTLAALGATYARLQLIDTGARDRGQAQRLQQDIANQIASLQDTIEALDDELDNQGAVLRS